MLDIYKVLFKHVGRLTLSLLLGGCLSPINLDTDTINVTGTIVIGGQISTIADRNYVEIGITSYKGRLPEPLSGAEVQLSDNLGNSYIYSENFARAGRYELPSITGIPGRKYKIKVKLDNGKTFESTEEVMPLNSGTDEISYEYVPEKYIDPEGSLVNEVFLKIYSKPTFPDIKPYLCRWSVEEVYQIMPVDFPDPFGYTPPSCYVTQIADPQKSVFFDGREFSPQSNLKIQVASRPIDQTFHYRHYFTIYHSAITAEAFDYWSKVNVLVNQTGSIFDTPPAEIIGNVKPSNTASTERVFGFFQATNQSYKRFFTLKADLPDFAYLATYCEYERGRETLEDYPLPCRSCIDVRNSSYERPIWF